MGMGALIILLLLFLVRHCNAKLTHNNNAKQRWLATPDKETRYALPFTDEMKEQVCFGVGGRGVGVQVHTLGGGRRGATNLCRAETTTNRNTTTTQQHHAKQQNRNKAEAYYEHHYAAHFSRPAVASVYASVPQANVWDGAAAGAACCLFFGQFWDVVRALLRGAFVPCKHSSPSLPL
jgi:hypothetical protein